jgi:hypothetical protein
VYVAFDPAQTRLSLISPVGEVTVENALLEELTPGACKFVTSTHGMEEGNWRVEVWAQRPDGSWASAEATFSVLIARVQVEVTVIDRGVGVGGAQVDVYRDHRLLATYWTDPTGRAEFELPEGIYVFVARYAGQIRPYEAGISGERTGITIPLQTEEGGGYQLPKIRIPFPYALAIAILVAGLMLGICLLWLTRRTVVVYGGR